MHPVACNTLPAVQKRFECECEKRSKQCAQLERALQQMRDEVNKENEVIKKLQHEVKQQYGKVARFFSISTP